MKTFLFIFLAGYAVRCDDSNYYVVQMPERLPTKEFKVYWNVPTMQCTSKKIPFDDLYKYGIIQNTGDSFRGDKIAILYDPGDFPALLSNSTSGEIKYRNGGVPQEGNLIKHLDTFQNVLDQSIPDKNFSGVGIIDFESWKPVLRQNFGVLTPYKDVSYEIEKKRHWWWKKEWIEAEAKRRFEKAGREFMQTSIALAKKMRPRALWGYYGFPYCFNMASNNRQEACADKVPQENDGISWLWQESTALFPSVYSTEDMSAAQLAALVRGRVREAARVGRRAPILPYFWYRYRDKDYFNQSDLNVAFSTFYKSNASGFIIWGSSSDVNTVDKCNSLKKYVTEILGPTVAKYTKPNIRQDDEVDEAYNTIFNNQSIYDPEYTWIPPVNYTQNIEQMVDQELKEEKETTILDKDIKESILVDMILNKIANYCVDGCDKHKVRKTVKGDSNSTSEVPVALVTEDPFKKIPNVDVTVPATTEDEMYDYDLATSDGAGKDFYDNENNDYFEVSTSNTEETSTTSISTEGTSISTEGTSISTETSTTSKNIEESSTFSISTEESSTLSTSTQEPSTYSMTTEGTTTVESSATDLDKDKSTTENSIDNTSTDQTNTTVYNSTIADNTTESSTVDLSTTQSTDDYRSESTSLSTEESTISISTLEPQVSSNTEESSTIYPKLEEERSTDATTSTTNDTDGTTGTFSGDDGTTLAPVLSEQVVVSVV